jgi:hypothetical protein
MRKMKKWRRGITVTALTAAIITVLIGGILSIIPAAAEPDDVVIFNIEDPESGFNRTEQGPVWFYNGMYQDGTMIPLIHKTNVPNNWYGHADAQFAMIEAPGNFQPWEDADSNELDAALSWLAQEDGYIRIIPSTLLYWGGGTENSGIRIRIMKNNTVLWPVDAEWLDIPPGSPDVSVESITAEIKNGDFIHFVVNAAGDFSRDGNTWKQTILFSKTAVPGGGEVPGGNENPGGEGGLPPEGVVIRPEQPVIFDFDTDFDNINQGPFWFYYCRDTDGTLRELRPKVEGGRNWFYLTSSQFPMLEGAGGWLPYEDEENFPVDLYVAWKAPEDGVVQIAPSLITYWGMGNGINARISVATGGEVLKIWPSASDWRQVRASNPEVEVDGFEFSLQKRDMVYFILNMGDDFFKDNAAWKPIITFTQTDRIVPVVGVEVEDPVKSDEEEATGNEENPNDINVPFDDIGEVLRPDFGNNSNRSNWVIIVIVAAAVAAVGGVAVFLVKRKKHNERGDTLK